MNSSQQSRFNVTADEIRQYDWQARLEQHPRKECWSFYEVFVAAAKECEAAGDDIGHRVYALLLGIASFHPNYDMRGNPYGPMWRNADGTSSLLVEDLNDSDLEALHVILNDINDPEYRARVGDVLWECKRDFKAAQIAVRAFLESAERLKTADLWPPYVERLDRAARISGIRGFQKEKTIVVADLEKAISEFENNIKSGLLCHRLMSILLFLDEGDRTRYAALAERLAQHFASVDEWHFSEDYWQLAEQWHRQAKNETEMQRCRLQAAECNVSRAEAGLKGSGTNYMYSAHWIGRGLEALRRAKAEPARIEEVHRRFLKLEKCSLSEMETIEMPVDKIPGFRELEDQTQKAAAAHVQGHDFQTAIIRFANVCKPTDLGGLKAQYAEISKETIFDKIIGTAAVDHTGKVADTVSPSGFGTPEAEAETLRKRLVHQARTINWPMQVAWKVEPARLALINEHGVRRSDLMFLVLNNPFIPQGHEGINVRGIQSGFFGDWLAAMHLLIPQIEASLRYVLQQNGVITSTLESDGIQKERDMNQLLWMPELEEIFGADITFDLRGILIERFGHNMRNESAHGLMPEAGFYQPASVYLWWLILHLCWKGLLIAQQPIESTDETITM
ncbi:DUF4209 domain-containing protein [Kamptonema cortianum]|nr:DUF4209 domain-containing protein [Kamptonema cortianum]MDL5048034.1 DUF4209 domain-containing protein [Oscillatoria amoena NRMC-F 0135]MDL5052516.1 DUF4209 domain-containing protein [Oscillatoria laete-virens NRMC-F 0139]